MPLDEASLARIAPYVSSPTQDVYALSGLPEEVVGVVFAYASRTEEGVRTSLARLLGEGLLDVGLDVGAASRHASKSANEFHRSWVAHRGANEIGEHAMLHVVIENVSLLATRAIQDHRLSAFVEKSLNYVSIRRDGFVDLPELGADAAAYRAAVDKLFATYESLYPSVYASLLTRTPREPSVTDAAHAEAVRIAATEGLRGLLPAGTRTSIALSGNAHAIDSLVTKLLSNPLAEVRRIGEAVLGVARGVAPRLFTTTAASAQRQGQAAAVDDVVRTIYSPAEESANATMVVTQPVRLVRHDKDALERIALALAYEGSDSRIHALGLVEGLRHATANELADIVRASVRGRGPADPPPRAFEATSMTFELMLDYGTYRELSRHRLVTPAPQRISCRLGFDTPSVVTEHAQIERVHDAMLGAHNAWAKLDAAHPWEAQYVVALGFRVRALWTMNARELLHVMELRSRRTEASGCRRIAHGLFRTTCAMHPWLRDVARVDLS